MSCEPRDIWVSLGLKGLVWSFASITLSSLSLTYADWLGICLVPAESRCVCVCVYVRAHVRECVKDNLVSIRTLYFCFLGP